MLLIGSYDNDIYIGNSKVGGNIPETKEEYKRLLLENVYNLNLLFAECSSIQFQNWI